MKKTWLTSALIFIALASFGQELTTIKVSVPNETDEVFITGNQESLGNWQPEKVKMNKISKYEREVSLTLSFPAEFKFTRGHWESEAIISKLSELPNLTLNKKPTQEPYYKIQGWTDEIDRFSTYSEFEIAEIESSILIQKRKIYVSLPENYNTDTQYPVIYVTDANILNTFEIVAQTIRQQANFKNFPECIIVGIYIDISNRNKELDIEYGENGKKFKDYIFKEVVPFIDQYYSTGSFKAIYGHSDGAEYNHYLMFEKDNPFDAIINISENLGGMKNENTEQTKKKFVTFLNTNNRPIKYFVASAEYDDPLRYPSGIEIEKIIRTHSNKNVEFQHKVYRSSHEDLIAYSVLDAFQFIFSDYQDYGLFASSLNSKDFNYRNLKEKYLGQNETYIKPYIENDISSAVIGEIIRQSKKTDILHQYFDNEDEYFEKYNLYTRAILFYEIGDLNTALYYLEKMVKENDLRSTRQLIQTKGKLYLEIYNEANKVKTGYNNLNVLQKNNPDLAEEIKQIKQR